MNARAVGFVVGNLLLILGVALIVPLVFALVYDSNVPAEKGEVIAFVVTASISLVVGFAARRGFRQSADQVRIREGFAIVGLSWIFISAIGMLPYLLTGATPRIVDAFFETVSGFTTTGASIFSEMEPLPHGLMLWRCMTQWLGGMGVVVLSVALLPVLGVGGYRLLKAESPGGATYEKERPRMTDAAKSLWVLYLGFSVVLCGLLWALGMNFFDAACHTFTTMSTGGFSSHTESAGYFGATIQWVLIVFMFLAGTNFSIHARLLRRDVLAVKNTEWLTYTAIILLAWLAAVVALSQGSLNETTARESAFQVISIATTTGFATADFNLWPHSMRMMLFLLMFIGGCMGSTAGGMKVARILIMVRASWQELHRLVYPHAVTQVRIDERVIPMPMVRNILCFAVLFLMCFLLGAAVMVAHGYGLVTAMSASIASLGNIGPGLDAVGPAAHWGNLPSAAKWVMSFLMLCGRLELFSVLILFTPGLWKR